MDCRDVKEVKYPENGNLMQGMIDLQKGLLDHYTGIEKLPMYPVDINIKENQVLLKDFSARVVEELGEAFESYEKAMASIKSSPDSTKSHVINFNEELADVLHFLLELMIYSDLEIKSELHVFVRIQDVNTKTVEQIMANDMSVPYYENQYPDQLTSGGWAFSREISDIQKQLMWDVTYQLQLARNCLKSKPWKQTEMLVDEKRYKEHLMASWVNLFKLFSFWGMDCDDVYTIYYKKNQVNLFRINSKY